jgi:hypothetical protein
MALAKQGATVMSFEWEILQAIRTAMPTDAKIRIVPGIDMINLSVSWQHNHDPARPAKIPGTIWICISRETAQDIARASAVKQGVPSLNVAAFLSAKLSTFDAQHNVPDCEAAPVERWIVDSTVCLPPQ